jgi:F-type H+-transporting ATPase subunit b
MEGLKQLFENNLINWLLLVVAIVFLWQKSMPAVFAARRKSIEGAIDEARRAREEGQAFLAEQTKRIENAEKEAEHILVEAKQVAQQLKNQITEQTKKDSTDLEKKIEQQISGHRQTVITELRSQAAIAALRLAEIELPAALSDNAKKGLQERFVGQLGKVDSLGGGGNQ